MKEFARETHIVIPIQIWDTPLLTWKEKCLWILINSLDVSERHCFATNKWIASKLGFSLSTIHRGLRKMEKLEMIKAIETKSNRFSGGVERRIIVQKRLQKIPVFKRSSSKKNSSKTEPTPHVKIDTPPMSKLTPRVYNKERRIKRTLLLRKRARLASADVHYSMDREFKRTLDVWNSLGRPFIKHRKLEGKRLQRAEKELERLLKKYKGSEIREAIKRGHAFLLNPGNKFAPLVAKGVYGVGKISIDDFFSFSLWRKRQFEGNKKNPCREINSWFDEIMKGEKNLEKYAYELKDGFPAISKRIQEGWENVVVRGRVSTARDRNNYKRCAEWLDGYVRSRADRLRVTEREKRFPAQFVPILISYFKTEVFPKRNGNIHTGFLRSEYLENDFDSWLIKNNIMNRNGG